MFTAMLDGLKEESVGFLFNINVEVQQPDGAAVAPQEAPEGLAEFASAAAQAAHGSCGPRA